MSNHTDSRSLLLVGGTGLARYRVQTDNGSPPLNTTRPVYLDALDQDARAALFDRFEQERPLLDRDGISRAAGGHPWLLSRLLGQHWGLAGHAFEAREGNQLNAAALERGMEEADRRWAGDLELRGVDG